MEKKTVIEFLRYCFIGGCTTFINYLIYIICLFLFHEKYIAANTIAWCFAVIFAFYANKHFVFQSETTSGKEIFSFFFLRLLTLLLENSLLYVCIQQLGFHTVFSKLAVSVVTVLSNYVLCKCKVFTNEKGDMLYEKN